MLQMRTQGYKTRKAESPAQDHTGSRNHRQHPQLVRPLSAFWTTRPHYSSMMSITCQGYNDPHFQISVLSPWDKIDGAQMGTLVMLTSSFADIFKAVIIRQGLPKFFSRKLNRVRIPGLHAPKLFCISSGCFWTPDSFSQLFWVTLSLSPKPCQLVQPACRTARNTGDVPARMRVRG